MEDKASAQGTTSWRSLPLYGPSVAPSGTIDFQSTLEEMPSLGASAWPDLGWSLDYASQASLHQDHSPDHSFSAGSSTLTAGSTSLPEPNFRGSYIDSGPNMAISVSPRDLPITQAIQGGTDFDFHPPYGLPAYPHGNIQPQFEHANLWPSTPQSFATLSLPQDLSARDVQDDRGSSPGSSTSDNSQARDDPLYSQATPGPDGLWHCPWTTLGFRNSETLCKHDPVTLKCNYDKMVDSHLKPYRCSQPECADKEFSSMACRLRHEREAHGLHNHGKNPNLCSFANCERSIHGFPRRWNLLDHVRRVHQKDEAVPPAPKRKNIVQDTGSEQLRKVSRHTLDTTLKAKEFKSLPVNRQDRLQANLPEAPSRAVMTLASARRRFDTSMRTFTRNLESDCSSMDPKATGAYTTCLVNLSMALDKFNDQQQSLANIP